METETQPPKKLKSWKGSARKSVVFCMWQQRVRRNNCFSVTFQIRNEETTRLEMRFLHSFRSWTIECRSPETLPSRGSPKQNRKRPDKKISNLCSPNGKALKPPPG